MAKKDKQQEEMQMFDAMPGADPIEPDPEPIDLSFGLETNDDEIVTMADVVNEDEVEKTEEEEVAEEVEEVSEEEVADEMELEAADTSDDAASRIVEEEEQTSDDEKSADEVAQGDDTQIVDDAQPKEATKRSKPNHMVPKKRLDEVLGKLKASQKELEDLKLAATPPPDAPEAYDFDAKEAEYMNLVLDGQTKRPWRFVSRSVPPKDAVGWEMGQKMAETVSYNQTATLNVRHPELEATFRF